MSTPFAETTFKSFDGAECVTGKLFCPDRYRLLENVFFDAETFSIQGAGVSYAPLSFGGGSATIQLSHFNRVLNFDKTTGIIEVESGMSLGDLAQITIPKGWYLKVQPGHPTITVGGCLAVDVHGKNQFQDLNFKEQVLFFNLYHPDKGVIFCDRSNNPDLFDLTCGGWGLSGVVVSIGIQLGKLTSTAIETETIRFDDIFQLPRLLKERSAYDDLIYSWHDFNSEKHWGSGFLKVGRYLKPTGQSESDFKKDLNRLATAKPLSSNTRGLLPMNLLNSFSVWAMNSAYSTKELRNTNPVSQSLVDFLFPVIDKTIYFDLFGKPGFHETQVLIPFEAFETVMKDLKSGLKKFSVPITLASCKLFKGKQELLRFMGEGIVIAINFPRSAESMRLLSWWDAIVINTKCIPNISKDSRLPLKVVENCYPQLQNFKTKLHSWDSKRVFQTSTSKRLHL